MKRIAVEEHFYTQEYVDYLHLRKDYPRLEIVEDKKLGKIERSWYSASSYAIRKDPEQQNGLLVDVEKVRLKEMDKTGIDMQVLSLSTPGVEAFDTPDSITWAKKTNDELAKIVKKRPEKFVGLAALPFQAPEAAADELERAVKKLGLRGAKVNSHVRGEYLDNKKFWIVFKMAERLGVPIYLHPREPSPDMIKPYLAYPAMTSAMWGFGAETGLHAMRLICSGVFDEYPRLKIIIGHMGEALPFWLWRIDNKWQPTPMAQKLRKKPSEYMRDNFFITTSGLFSQPALLCAYLTLGADNILFAVDYPMESNELAVQFMDSAPISESDKEKICHLNAEKLFAL